MSVITDVLDDEGRLVNLKYLPEEVRACISEIRFSDDGVVKSIKSRLGRGQNRTPPP
jgi:hypothetical protein